MYYKKIVAKDEKNVTISKETFCEMTIKIARLEQAADDHEYLKYDFQRQREKINELENKLEEANDENAKLENEFLTFTEVLKNDLRNSQNQVMNLQHKYERQKMLCDSYAEENRELKEEIKEKDQEIKELHDRDLGNSHKIYDYRCYIRCLENKLDDK